MFSLLLLCSLMAFCTATASRHSYNESLARNEMLRLASAAYSDTPEACFTNMPIEVIKKWKVPCIKGEDHICAAYLARVNTCRAIVIAFSGTRNIYHVLRQMEAFLTNKFEDFYDKGKVHDYHKKAFDSVFLGDMESVTREYVMEHPNCDIWVTGHSLGGALASLAAEYIVLKGIQKSNKVLLYTYGQPRVGTRQFAREHDRLVPHSYRITHSDDIVVDEPKNTPSHPGGDPSSTGLFLPQEPNTEEKFFYHHQHEIHYKDGMGEGAEYIECVGQEDPNCVHGTSTTNIFDSISAHQYYFETEVGDWGHNGCRAPVQKPSDTPKLQLDRVMHTFH